MKNFTVLVAERTATSSKILDYLKDGGNSIAKIKKCDSLERGRTLLIQNSFDAILLDPDLIDTQGFETVLRFVTAAPEAAVIVISDQRSDEGLAIKSVRFGAQDYIERQHLSPFYLMKSITYAVERKSRLQEKGELLLDLANALKMVDTLQNLLPLCASCQKIYYEKESRWMDLSAYLQTKGVRKSRKVCPDCLETLK